jgi:hypothetical protein
MRIGAGIGAGVGALSFASQSRDDRIASAALGSLLGAMGGAIIGFRTCR